jgi:hypothetical protein
MLGVAKKARDFLLVKTGMGTRRRVHAVLALWADHRIAHCHANTRECTSPAPHEPLLLSTIVALAVFSNSNRLHLGSTVDREGADAHRSSLRAGVACAVHRGRPSGACQARLEEAFWHAARQSRSHMPDSPFRQAPAATVRTSSAHCRNTRSTDLKFRDACSTACQHAAVLTVSERIPSCVSHPLNCGRVWYVSSRGRRRVSQSGRGV